MLRPIAELPEGVLGFEVTGEIQVSDYAERERAIAWAAGDG
jgi:hypothetical protein